MSIHSLAKSLGISEYALRKYAEENHLERDSKSRSSGYKFSSEDLEKIKSSYGKKKKEKALYLMFRIYDSNRCHHYLPAGFFPLWQEQQLKDFVSMQYSCSNMYRKKCFNFFICNERQYKTRLRKLQNTLGNYLFEMTIKQIIPQMIKSEELGTLIENKEQIKYQNFVPKQVQEKLNINTPFFDDDVSIYDEGDIEWH